MKKFKHLVSFSEQNYFQKNINHYGERGWKLCASFIEGAYYKLIFVREVEDEVDTKLKQSFLQILNEWGDDTSDGSDRRATDKMQAIAEDFAIRFSWWRRAIVLGADFKVTPQYFYRDGESTPEIKPDRDLLVIYKSEQLESKNI